MRHTNFQKGIQKVVQKVVQRVVIPFFVQLFVQLPKVEQAPRNSWGRVPNRPSAVRNFGTPPPATTLPGSKRPWLILRYGSNNVIPANIGLRTTDQTWHYEQWLHLKYAGRKRKKDASPQDSKSQQKIVMHTTSERRASFSASVKLLMGHLRWPFQLVRAAQPRCLTNPSFGLVVWFFASCWRDWFGLFVIL